MAKVDVDPFHILALSVPGAIGGDLLYNGQREAIIVGGLLGFAVCDYIQVDESSSKKEVRRTLRTAPLIGLGAGYGAARIGGLAPAQAIVPGLLGAIAAMMIYRKTSNQKMNWPAITAATTPTYPSVPSSGNPPLPPGAQGPVL